MPYIFDEGEAVEIGEQGEHDALYADGDPVPDTGRSTLVFEEGTGLGGEAATVTISDSNGKSTGDVVIIERDQTIEDYYGFDDSGDSASAEGPINNFLELRKTTFYVYKNQSTGEYSFGYVHDVFRPDERDTGGRVDFDVSGLPQNTSHVVQDDPPSGNDSYSFNPPNGTIDQQWGDRNTDGIALGKFTTSDLDGTTVTFDVTLHKERVGFKPDTVKFAGDGGTTVERPYDGTNTVVEIKFGSSFNL